MYGVYIPAGDYDLTSATKTLHDADFVLLSAGSRLSYISKTKTLDLNWNVAHDYVYITPASIPSKSAILKRLAVLEIANILIQQDGWLLKQKLYVDYHLIFKVELHGFCNASKEAFAALYLRTKDESRNVYSHLLTAKTKIARIKFMSLQGNYIVTLCDAELLVKLIDSLKPELNLSGYPLRLRTDTTIVVPCLQKPSCHWARLCFEVLGSKLLFANNAEYKVNLS
uniref:Uncharacterized protein n=1 Tax=Glossina pallidipes TaxID=7398 RepID=A0A1A9Z266_GLOPL